MLMSRYKLESPTGERSILYCAVICSTSHITVWPWSGYSRSSCNISLP